MSIRTVVVGDREEAQIKLDHEKIVIWASVIHICFSITNVALNEIFSEAVSVQLANDMVKDLSLSTEVGSHFHRIRYIDRSRENRFVQYNFSMLPRDTNRSVDIFMAMAAAYGIGEVVRYKLSMQQKY